MAAFASHFLMDAFSSGHARVPRKHWMESTIGNIASKVIHNLDSERGIFMANADWNTTWIAYGDGFLDHPENAHNKALMQEAIRRSKQDLCDALAKRSAYTIPKTFPQEKSLPYMRPSLDVSRWNTPDKPGFEINSSAIKSLLQTTRAVAAQELPGLLKELTTNDNDARNWIQKYDVSMLARMPWNEKARLFAILLSGWTGKEDFATAHKLRQSVTSPEELAWLRSKVWPQVGQFLLERQKQEADQLFEWEPLPVQSSDGWLWQKGYVQTGTRLVDRKRNLQAKERR